MVLGRVGHSIMDARAITNNNTQDRCPAPAWIRKGQDESHDATIDARRTLDGRGGVRVRLLLDLLEEITRKPHPKRAGRNSANRGHEGEADELGRAGS